MLIIKKLKGTNLLVIVENVFFWGIHLEKKGWKLYDIEAKECFVSRDVKFVEHIFPFQHSHETPISPDLSSTFDFALPFDYDDDYEWPHASPNSPASPSLTTPLTQAQLLLLAQTCNLPLVPVPCLLQYPSPLILPPLGHPAPHHAAAPQNTAAPSSTTSPSDSSLGRIHQAKLPLTWLRDYVTNTIVAPHSESSPSISGSATPSGTPYPLAHYINCNNFSMNYRKFLAVISTQEPRSFKEAVKDTGWRASMQQQIQALEDNGTWTLEPLPPGKHALGSQWVYRIKYNFERSIERLKSRLVVFGCNTPKIHTRLPLLRRVDFGGVTAAMERKA